MRTSPPLRNHPSKLFVEITTRCNLRCRMCVKEIWDKKKMEGDLSSATFAALEPALPHLDALILNGVGEPLLDPRLERFIRQARNRMQPDSWVGFQTNGLLLDEARALSLVRAGLGRICISVDAVSPEKFKEIRKGGEGHDVQRALEVISAVKARTGQGLPKIGIEFVIMRDNLPELPAVLRWAASYGVDFAIVTHVLPYVEECVGQVAYEANMDASLDLFKRWEKKAESEGVDLRVYATVLKKQASSPNDHDLVVFAEDLLADGAQGENLLRARDIYPGDGDWNRAVEQIFAGFDELQRQGGHREGIEGLLGSWRRGAGRRDLIECLVKLWKNLRTSRELKIVVMVEAMEAEAQLQSIYLNVRNLIERDVAWPNELGRMFRELTLVAAENRIDLHLPAVTPLSNRQCDFVEDGSVFISCKGDVHPCYFLWHGYSCHFPGRKKHVAPRSFGNLADAGILEIWNSEAFRTFREDVTRYDYPFCSNCDVVPCEFMESEEFSQDCYGNSIPCADCYWGMGLFNCLR